MNRPLAAARPTGVGVQGLATGVRPKIIVNAQRAPEGLDEALRAAGIEGDLLLVGGGLAKAAAEAVANGARLIVAGGGDGTVNAVAAAVAGTPCVLGILPLGTFNNFARDLSIPLDTAGAVRTLARGRVVEIDAAEVNGRVFVNNSSLGIYPWIVERREHQERRGRGRFLSVCWAALAALRRYPFIRVYLEADGRGLARETPFVFTGNNVYRLEGLRAARRDSISEGVLSLAVAHRTGRLGLLRLAWSALIGRLREERDFDLVTAREIRIEMHRRSARVSLDGEVARLDTPLHYRIRPRALRVVVPAG